MIEFGKGIGSISDLIDFLQKVEYKYGNDTPIKIIDPIDHRYCGTCCVQGFGKNGSIMLSGLYIFGITDEDIQKKALDFVINHKDSSFLSKDSLYQQGLLDGYIGCMNELIKNRNID